VVSGFVRRSEGEGKEEGNTEKGEKQNLKKRIGGALFSDLAPVPSFRFLSS
jgi:hypothetical protein